MSLITEADEYVFKLELREKKRYKVCKKYHCDKNVREILSKFPEIYGCCTHLSVDNDFSIESSLVRQWRLLLNDSIDKSNREVVIINLENCVFCEAFNYEVKIEGMDEHSNAFKGCWYIEKTTSLLKSELKQTINKILRQIYGRKTRPKRLHI